MFLIFLVDFYFSTKYSQRSLRAAMIPSPDEGDKGV